VRSHLAFVTGEARLVTRAELILNMRQQHIAAQTRAPVHDPAARCVPIQDPMLTIIVPTRNEAGNVEALATRIRDATAGIPTEVIFVDDSTDNTPDLISRLTSTTSLPVRLIHRPPERRGDGLGGAVVEGMRAAKGRWLCVMDADLQHPPEVISRLLASATAQQADLVIASRFAATAQAQGLGRRRRVASTLTRLCARLLFAAQAAKVSDPLTGYFLVARSAIEPDRLHPRGFKILLEILVRFPRLRVAEVPFEFGKRYSGQSKASLREGLRYAGLLLDLRFGRGFLRASQFGLVGASGLVINQLLLLFFTELGALYYVASAVLATQGSTAWNFVLTNNWVFTDRAPSRSFIVRLRQTFLVNNAILLGRGPLLIAMTDVLGIHYLVSNVLTVVAFALTRYAVSDRWIWAQAPGGSRSKLFCYDIHNIITIVSESRLPELEYFRVHKPIDHPDVRIKVGSAKSRPTPSSERNGTTSLNMRYADATGRVGFWVEIAQGDCVDITISHLLSWSPHVLYTNVVEPILRWMFVQRGYALMHGACIAVGHGALLVTARTDTGKTSTILRLLAQHRLDFLSDDMVILRADGRVLCYPKPLTISRHTLEAVNGAADLSRSQRLALQLQSRVHSKSGRGAAHAMTRLPLPVATINTLVQMLIPPPKYSISRLVPGVGLRRDAIIGQRVEIERGPDREIPLPSELAATIALEDCEDAYGFPPYRELEPALTTWGGEDLRKRERQIIAQALQRCPTTLVSRRRRDWSARIAELYVEQPEWVKAIHGVDHVNGATGVNGANGVAASNGHAGLDPATSLREPSGALGSA
jgi:putative flippase GtrA